MIDFEAITKKHDEVRRKRRAADNLLEKTTDTSVKLSGMPHGGGNENQQEAKRIAYIYATEELQLAEAELQTMLVELKKAMRRLKEWQHKDAIRKRYVDGLTVWETAEKIGYSLSQTKRIIDQAIREINRA